MLVEIYDPNVTATIALVHLVHVHLPQNSYLVSNNFHLFSALKMALGRRLLWRQWKRRCPGNHFFRMYGTSFFKNNFFNPVKYYNKCHYNQIYIGDYVERVINLLLYVRSISFLLNKNTAYSSLGEIYNFRFSLVVCYLSELYKSVFM